MALEYPFITDLRLQDAGFVLAWLLAIVLLVPVQLASMIVFDATGLDTLAPSFVFMTLVPAFVLTVFPALVAWRLYTRGVARAITAIAFTVFAIVAAYTSQFYGLCGPNC